MATYYHVSLDMAHTGVFTPSVPADRYDSEDSTVKRICVADSIQGCFNAIPGELLFSSDYPGYFKLFEFDTDQLGISDSSIIKPETLYMNYGVYDAIATGEHWLLNPITVPTDKQFVCKLNWFDDFSHVILSDKQSRKLAESLNDEMTLPTDPIALFHELYAYANHASFIDLESRIGETIASARNISDYGITKSLSAESQDVYLETIDQLKPFELGSTNVSVTSRGHNEIRLSVKPHVDISDLLLAHFAYCEEIELERRHYS